MKELEKEISLKLNRKIKLVKKGLYYCLMDIDTNNIQMLPCDDLTSVRNWIKDFL